MADLVWFTVQLFWVATPMTSMSQSFSIAADAGAGTNSLAVLAFSGTATTGDVLADEQIVGEDHLDAGVFQAGSVVASLAGQLAVSFVCGGYNSPEGGIDDGFTRANYLRGSFGNGVDIGSAYLLDPTSGVAIDPTWTLKGDTTLEGVNAVFRGAH
jgi:hypothetical protein